MIKKINKKINKENYVQTRESTRYLYFAKRRVPLASKVEADALKIIWIPCRIDVSQTKYILKNAEM